MAKASKSSHAGVSRRFFGAPDALQKCAFSMDLESVAIDSPSVLEGASLEEVQIKKGDADKPEKDRREAFEMRIVAFSGVILLKAGMPDNSTVKIGSFPSIENPEPLGDAEMAYLINRVVFNFAERKSTPIEGIGLDKERVTAIFKQSGFDICENPVLFAAGAQLDMEKVFFQTKRSWISSPLVNYPASDKVDELANPYIHRSKSNSMRVDPLDIERAGGAIRTRIKLEDICRMYRLPGKYLPVKGGSVDELWRKGMMKELLDYNRVDALNHHFLLLYYMHFSDLIKRQAFDTLWTRSAKQLEEQMAEKHDDGLKWFLDKLPTSSQMKVITMR